MKNEDIFGKKIKLFVFNQLQIIKNLVFRAIWGKDGTSFALKTGEYLKVPAGRLGLGGRAWDSSWV